MGSTALLNKLLPQGAQSVTVLWHDGQTLKLVHARGLRAQRRIESVWIQAVHHLSHEEVLTKLREACAERRVTPASILVANPAHLTTARLFSLPSTDPKEIRDIVQLQAEKHTPYAKEEILTDFAVLDVDPAGYSRVLLAIAHQDVIYRALRVVEGMGWPLERVGLELEGLVRWFRQAQPQRAAAPTVVVAVDQETATLVVIHQDKPYFHRSIPVGAAQLLEQPREAPLRFLSELQRSLEALESEGLNLTPGQMVLTGLTMHLQELLPAWQEALKLPLTLVPAGQGFTLPAAEGDPQEAPWASCPSLLGLTLEPGSVDLTPAPLKLHQVFEQRARRLMQVGAQLMAVLIVISGLMLGSTQRDQRYRAQLRAEDARVTASAEVLQQQLKRVELLRGWAAVQGQCLDAFTEVVRQSPPEVRWDAMDFRQNDQMIMKGTSTELSKVYDLVATLQRTGRFTQVEARRIAKKRQGDQDVSSFEMVCQLGAPPAGAAEQAS